VSFQHLSTSRVGDLLIKMHVFFCKEEKNLTSYSFLSHLNSWLTLKPLQFVLMHGTLRHW
jgi:hypothetical protein